MLKAYPDEEEMTEQYQEVFLKLVDMEPTLNKEKFKLVLENAHEEWDFYDTETEETEHVVEDFVSVYGKKPKCKDRYSIEFAPWSEWLSMTIDSKTLKEFSPAEIAAHCLWEMTFIGFDEENIEDVLEDLKNTIDGFIDSFEDSKTKRILFSKEVKQNLLDKWEEHKNNLLNKIDERDDEE